MGPPQFGYQMPSPAGLPGYRPPSPRSRSRTNLMGQPQPQPQPQPATTLASQMAQKPIFTSGNFGAGVKTASTPLTKGTSSQAVPTPPQPFSQIPQAQAQNLVNRAVTSTISPSASTAEVVCIFQGKATYTSKIGAKQEGNVKVFFFGAEKGGRVRMETLSTNQIILNHDINTLKLVASFTPTLVTWKRPQHDGKGEETVNLNFDNAELAQKLKSVLQKIQEAGKKSEASPPKPAVATPSPFTISGSQAFKPTTTQTPTGSSPAVFGQAQTGMPASAALAALSAKQGEEKTVQSGETPKPSFGGFTFSGTPVIKTPEDKSKASPTVKLKESSLKVTSPVESGTVAANQPKPFAGFTFTQTKPMTQQAPVTVGPSSASAASSIFTLGQNIGSPMPSFSNLAANTSATGFSGLKTTHDSPSKGEDEERVEEYEPNVDFKPVIDLPDLVEMKTGEEDEEKLFGERARLFRFDADTNQWKERGIGEVKILYNKAAKRYRILMRREQVLKICANHNITKDMKLTPMTSSDRAWCWSAMDFAEEEMKMEKLAIKFKTPELACQFKECFEKYQNMLEDSPVKPIPEAIGSSEVAEKKEDPKGKKSLADMFKPKTGSWECQGCYCVNKGEQLKCPACNTIKPGAEEEVKKAETAKPAAGISSGGFKIGEGGFQIGGAAGGGGFSLGKKQEGGGFSFGSASSGGGFSFASKPAQEAEPTSKDSPKETAVDPGREAAKNILKSSASTIGPGGFSLGGGGFKLDGVDSDGFSFSPKPSTPAKPAKSEPADSTTGGLLAEMLQSNDPQPKTTAASSAATSGFSFTPKSSGFNFASAADSAKKDGGFQFNLGKVSTPVKNQEKKEIGSPFQFTFSLTPSKTPQSKTTVTSPKSPEGDYYVNKEGEDSHIYFEPIVSLPDKVDVKTGEEEEVTRFEQRAKLFRFSEGEWKERGLGTMKILEHKTSHRYRLLMRREQIFKVCCNHVITPELELKPMGSGDGKSWVWYAKDFSEGEGKVEQLAIKFKNKEIADQFKKVFDDGKAGGGKGASAATEGDVSAKHIEVETLMTSSTKQVSGDSGNPYYKAELELLSVEPLQSSRYGLSTGDMGNPYYKEALDTSEVEEHMSSVTVQGTGDKGTLYYRQHLNDSEKVEATIIHGTGEKGNPYYKSGLDLSSVEPLMSSSNVQGQGDKGNPYHEAELEKSGMESLMTSVDIQGTGNKGNPYYKTQLEQSSVEPLMKAANIQGTGDKGNPYCTAKFGQTVITESMSATKLAHSTGDEGNPYYSSELDRLVGEPLLSRSRSGETGDLGNPYYSSQLDQTGVEPMIHSSSTQRTGSKGNRYYTDHLDSSVVVETVKSVNVSQGTGEGGNPYYSSALDKLIDEPRMSCSSSQGTGNLGNPYYSSKLNDTSDVQSLYIEEATEEQKARARKYLLPESFYLYENKPPCPGCIGCEDYDPSKVSVPSKVKAKSKSEETSRAPRITSVKVSSSASSVAGSVGASEGFSMFGQASGMSFSTLTAQGDAVGFAFKKDENRPFQWSGAGQQIFGSSPGGNRTNDGDDDDEVVQGDDIDFKPIIELPELVEVKTGEVKKAGRWCTVRGRRCSDLCTIPTSGRRELWET
ncbi:E3 SUMO-protein ligase RanBP2-like isoform X2 [Haliotis rubra]|uniref:E3 SUMO-protein ligase RanBP2-like isoform X2 n=1 Tax=Haliotis rubra TaxID=36100 RepID=UPI001EE52324|nr:E3 SUMO-protein ligase RanBP2-like isoform X2 [Haliotis rubra]